MDILNQILILFAHPRFEKSRVNRVLIRHVQDMPGITVNDLYEEYPDFNIDVKREQTLLRKHDVIVWQHPVYMYGAPALLKQWIDMVLEYGWAHGEGGDNLKGKLIFNVVTAGGTRETYAPGGRNAYPLRMFLVPFEKTAGLCKMVYSPPLVVHGTYLLTEGELEGYGRLYRGFLERLTREGPSITETIREYEYLNDWPGLGTDSV
ncbi:MAG: modulator of glutathione-dependent potassium efflux system [Deltaproteobacteria bacterium]|nr:modulator of glutathione-dependent potassium efflux system [Deltaproteobacteria bacterium]